MFGIVALSRNNVIGVNNKIPWHYPEDMRFFKYQTKNSTVIMGRKTWESIRMKPLPDRLNIVLSSQNPSDISPDISPENLVWCNTKQEVLDILESKLITSDIYVIGGNQIYELFADNITKWFITRIPLDIKRNDAVLFNEELLEDFNHPSWFPASKLWLSDEICVEMLERKK